MKQETDHNITNYNPNVLCQMMKELTMQMMNVILD